MIVYLFPNLTKKKQSINPPIKSLFTLTIISKERNLGYPLGYLFYLRIGIKIGNKKGNLILF